MSTRFIATKDCPITDDYKQAIVPAKDSSTEIANRGVAPARYLRTVSANSQIPCSAGQVAGLIRNTPTVDELIQTMVNMATLINNQVTAFLSYIG